MALNSQNLHHFDTLLYRVKPNDTLTKILTRYHPNATAEELQGLTAKILADNQRITDPD